MAVLEDARVDQALTILAEYFRANRARPLTQAQFDDILLNGGMTLAQLAAGGRAVIYREAEERGLFEFTGRQVNGNNTMLITPTSAFTISR